MDYTGDIFVHKFFLIISGPTGVGKTDLSFELAKRFSIEIVNCDVGQFYTPLSVGTAKPEWQSEHVPHHLFDIIDEPTSISVTEYRSRLVALFNGIWGRGNLPVLVGGSLFYIRSLLFPPLSQENDGKSSGFLEIDTNTPSEELWQKLHEIDPKRAQAIDKNDPYRIARALKIWELTRELPSSKVPNFDPLANFHITFVTRDRAELYERINSRLHQMFDAGWVEEVAGLSDEWQNFLLKKRLIGYPEIIACLKRGSVDSCKSNDELIRIIQKKTRNYAKRQMTFWRMLERQVSEAVVDYNAQKGPFTGTCQELNLTFSSVDLYLDHVTQLINQFKG